MDHYQHVVLRLNRHHFQHDTAFVRAYVEPALVASIRHDRLRRGGRHDVTDASPSNPAHATRRREPDLLH